MLIEALFAHARRTPGKRAICHNGRDIAYGEFARWIAHARKTLELQNLPCGGVAVLNLYCLIDAWVFGLALRSLGITTIAAPSNEELNLQGLDKLCCVIAATDRRPPPTDRMGTEPKLIRIPEHMYLKMRTEDARTELATPRGPVGGHILLTSGTTGRRKMVLIDEDILARITSRYAAVFGLSENSTVNLLGFGKWTGAGYKIAACAWTVGGAVLFHQGPGQSGSLLAEGLTHAVTTPGVLAKFLREQDKIQKNEPLKLLVGGGPLTRSLASGIQTRLTSRIFTYAVSTETGPWAFTPIETADDLRAHRIHPTAEVQIVDETDRPLPPGQMGTVRIRTADSVSLYAGDEAASYAAFRHGYFYSGDLGTFLTDGRLALNGRINNVLNILGSKRPAEEVEDAIREGLSVTGVCVFALQDENAEDEFHVIIETPRPIGRARLAPAVQSQLGAVSPTRVRFVDALPRNDLGKIDRGAVRRMVMAMRDKPA